MYTCSACGANFTRGDNLRRHEREKCRKSQPDGPLAKRCKLDNEPSTSRNLQMCNCCNKTIPVNQMIAHSRTLEHRTNSCGPLTNGVQVVRSAFQSRITSYRIHSENHHIDYVTFFSEIKHKILSLLEEVLGVHHAVKVNMEVFGRYILQTQETFDIKAFNTPNKILDRSMDLCSELDLLVDMMVTQTTEFQERDSGMCIFTEVDNGLFNCNNNNYFRMGPRECYVC